MDKRKKILTIIAVITIVIITMIVTIVNLCKNQKLIELQKIATIKYFEECMDTRTLYLRSENTYTDVNDTQFLEIQLKMSLDKYFKENAGAVSAPADQIKSDMWNPYNYEIDFNGIIIPGYTYKIEDNAFELSTENEADNKEYMDGIMEMIESKVKNVDDQEIKVDKIEKIGKNKFMVYADLIGYRNLSENNEENMPDNNPENMMDSTSQSTKEVVANAFITVEVKDGDFVISNIQTKEVK